ncbi:MAG: hypothetical protein KAY24_15675, partial [Candidatus Eisenbacteria sp.]|nr:hypothetical protein [Candidatus Eisenbacteria bacterium]
KLASSGKWVGRGGGLHRQRGDVLRNLGNIDILARQMAAGWEPGGKNLPVRPRNCRARIAVKAIIDRKAFFPPSLRLSVLVPPGPRGGASVNCVSSTLYCDWGCPFHYSFLARMGFHDLA